MTPISLSELAELFSSLAAEISLKDFANSAFTTSLLGALAGAYGGAIAAQKISDRSKEREQIVSQLKITNSGIVVAFSVCNIALSLKRQYTRSLYEDYFREKERLAKHQETINKNFSENRPAFEFQANLQSLQMPLFPIEILKNFIYEKILIGGRSLALVATLAGIITALEKMLNNRNNIIEEFKKMPQAERDKALPLIYFGLEFGPGHTNSEFEDCIKGIYSHTDDVIFLSELLCKDLWSYGSKLVEKFESKFGKSEHKVSSIDFSYARSLGLMPKEENYGDWLRGFRQHA